MIVRQLKRDSFFTGDSAPDRRFLTRREDRHCHFPIDLSIRYVTLRPEYLLKHEDRIQNRYEHGN